jgi:hypothetical protein
VAELLKALWEAWAVDQAGVLAARAAAITPLDTQYIAVLLLEVLRQAGAHKQIKTLVRRLSAAGHFDLYLRIDDHRERFRFGQDPDGSPAAPWTWDDLQ